MGAFNLQWSWRQINPNRNLNTDLSSVYVVARYWRCHRPHTFLGRELKDLRWSQDLPKYVDTEGAVAEGATCVSSKTLLVSRVILHLVCFRSYSGWFVWTVCRLQKAGRSVDSLESGAGDNRRIIPTFSDPVITFLILAMHFYPSIIPFPILEGTDVLQILGNVFWKSFFQK